MGLFSKVTSDPKTSITAIIGGIAQAVAVFGFNVTPETQMAIVTLTVVLLGIVSRDTKELPPPREG
jgi:hypothetical protein